MEFNKLINLVKDVKFFDQTRVSELYLDTESLVKYFESAIIQKLIELGIIKNKNDFVYLGDKLSYCVLIYSDTERESGWKKTKYINMYGSKTKETQRQIIRAQQAYYRGLRKDIKFSSLFTEYFNPMSCMKWSIDKSTISLSNISFDERGFNEHGPFPFLKKEKITVTPKEFIDKMNVYLSDNSKKDEYVSFVRRNFVEVKEDLYRETIESKLLQKNKQEKRKALEDLRQIFNLLLFQNYTLGCKHLYSFPLFVGSFTGNLFFYLFDVLSEEETFLFQTLASNLFRQIIDSLILAEEDVVDRCRRDIVHSTFFAHDEIRKNVSHPEKLWKYIESELIGKPSSGSAVSTTLESMMHILGNKIIYGAVSFYDHYRSKWLPDFYGFSNADDESNLLQFFTSNTFFPLTSFLIEGQDGYSKTCKLRHRSLNGDSDSIGHHEYICKQFKFNQDMKNIATITNKETSATVNLSQLDNTAFREYIKNYQVELEKDNLQEAFGIDIGRLEEEKNGKDKIRRIENLFKFFFAQKESNNWKFLYCFTPTYKLPSGVIFIYMRDRLNDNFVNLIQLLANQLFFQFAVALNVVKAEENLKKHGTRAAAASIIGRNMSHNIGSHVIYYLSNSFQNSDRNPFDKILKEFIGKCKQKENPDFQQILKDFEGNDKANTFEKFYNHMSTFLNYLQARMDYVALAGTIEPGYGQGMKIKDLMEEFEADKFLIKGIARSEGVNKIEIKPNKSSFKGLVTIPFGEIGKHAFFSILENIIRNSAKHGHDKIEDGKLSLYYSVKEETNNGRKYIGLEIYDELGTWSDAKEAMHLPEEANEQPPKEANEQPANESPLINEDGSLAHAYMGIKEIKISAAFLRMIPFYEIDSEKHENLLKLVPYKNSLMYKILLRPYKNLLIVTDGNEGLSSVNEEYGIDKAGIEYLNKKGESIDEYKIAVLDDKLKENMNELKKEKKDVNGLPNRFVYCKDISNKLFDDATILDVYKQWIGKTYGIDPDNEHVYYNPSGGENKENLKKKWGEILYVDDRINECNVRFQAHLEKFQHYEKAYNDITKDTRTITAEDISKRSHILKERLNSPPDGEVFEKQLFRLELLESAFSRVLIIDERLFSEYQCHWHDFEINGNEYRISYGDGALPDRGDRKTIFNFSHDEFIEIAKWLRERRKILKNVTFSHNSKNLEYSKENKPLSHDASNVIEKCVKCIGQKETMEKIKFLYEKRKDFYRFHLKNIEIGNSSTTNENNKISFINLEGKPLFSLKKNSNGKLSLNGDNKALNKFHFFSLHLGIIDKIRETLNCSESDIIKGFDSSLENTYFSLHTGRGKTLQTKDYPIRFMDFTTLNNWLNGSKWMFVQGLYSIKKRIYN